MTALTLLKHWKLILGGLALTIALLWGAQKAAGERHWRKRAEAAVEQVRMERMQVAEAQARATAIAQEAARNREAANDQIREQSEKKYAAKYAADRAGLVGWLRDNAASGDSSSGTDMPASAASAGEPIGPGATAAVDVGTLDTCTVNTRRLMEARDWWRSIEQTQGAN